MTGALAEQTAQQLRSVLDDLAHAAPDLPSSALAAFGRLVDILETGADAVVFAADATVSTQQAASLLGVSRMTVVRLVDGGELPAEGAVHRRIAVSELARYQDVTRRRRRAAIAVLADDIDENAPDEVVRTR